MKTDLKTDRQTRFSDLTPEQIQALTQAQFEALFRFGLLQMTEDILNLAGAVQIADAKGFDLSFYPNPKLISDLRRVAAGSTLPGVVVKFVGRVGDKVKLLPLQDQQRICDHGTVPLLVEVEPGKVETLMASVEGLQSHQMKQVFDGANLRPIEQQRTWLEEQRSQAALKNIRTHADNAIRVDRKNNLVVINGMSFSVQDLTDLIKKIS